MYYTPETKKVKGNVFHTWNKKTLKVTYSTPETKKNPVIFLFHESKLQAPEAHSGNK